jgi:nucleotide-binding universal stress UspA family protein
VATVLEKVLLAVDGSEHSDRAAAAVAELAGNAQSEVLVLHLQELGVTGRAGPLPLEPKSEAADLVNRVVGELRGAGINARGEAHAVLTRDVAPQILASATEFGAGLIVMGTRGLSDFAALVLGSVAHKVIHHAPCPVLVTR